MNQSRRLIFKWPPARRVEARAKTVYFILSKKGKPMRRVKYECEKCGRPDLKRTEVNLDHKEPVVDPIQGFVSLDVYFDRLFCAEENLWIICTQCHEVKTAAENEIRKLHKTESEAYFKKGKKK